VKALIASVLTFAALSGAIGSVGALSAMGSPRPLTQAPVFPWVPKGGYPDPFPPGQCTYWAAYNHLVTWNGNAGDWLANAKAQGVATASTPSVGAIAVFRPGAGYSELGHVALVTAVGPHTYSVGEMNYLGLGQLDARTIGWPDPHLAGFIPLAGAL